MGVNPGRAAPGASGVQPGGRRPCGAGHQLLAPEEGAVPRAGALTPLSVGHQGCHRDKLTRRCRGR